MAIITNSWLKDIGIATIGLIVLKQVGKVLSNKLDIEFGKATVDTSLFAQGILRLKWQVNITNNNPVNVTIYGVDGKIYYTNVMVANVSINQPFFLEKGVKKDVVLNIDIPAAQVVGDVIQNIIDNGVFSSLSSKIKFVGTIYTSAINIPINQVIQIF